MENELAPNIIIQFTKAVGDITQAVAVMAAEIKHLREDLTEIKTSLKETVATKDGLVQVATSTEARLLKLESASTFNKWVTPIVSGLLASAFTFLLVNYLTHLK